MRTFTTLLLLTFLTLPSCMSFSPSPRNYTYQVDLRNASGRPISVEFLRIESSRVDKTRCDLAIGGFYTIAFTTYNSAEYLEARLRFLESPMPHPAVWIAELPQGQTRADIVFKDDHLALQERPNSVPDPN